MFDYVKRSELDAERDLRIRAEADRDAADRENTRLLEMLEAERTRFEQAEIRHHEQVETLLKHTAPLAPDFTGIVDGETGQQRSLSPLEAAMMMPARGPQEVWAKRNYISTLRRELGREAQSEGKPQGDGDLTPGEVSRVAELATQKRQ